MMMRWKLEDRIFLVRPRRIVFLSISRASRAVIAFQHQRFEILISSDDGSFSFNSKNLNFTGVQRRMNHHRKATMRPTVMLILCALAWQARLSSAFIGSFPVAQTRTRLNYCNDLPTLEQASTDHFTEQTFYASLIVKQFGFAAFSLVTEEDLKDQIVLQQLLTAQLSHHDGIRGFFAVYLTGEGETIADTEHTPLPLSQALKRADMEKFTPLACMSVIRPTVMASWHTDPVLSANSAKTAERGKRILSSLKGSINVIQNCEAIYMAASGCKGGNEERVKVGTQICVGCIVMFML